MSPLGWSVAASRVDVTLEIIDRSGIEADLEKWAHEDGAERIQASRHPYAPRALIAILLLLTFAGQPRTLNNMFKAIWFDFSGEVLARLGLDRVVTDARRQKLGPPLLDGKEWRAEKQRFRDHCDHFFGLINPSPHRQGVRKMNADLFEEQKALGPGDLAAYARKRERLLVLLNKIVAASAHIASEHILNTTGHDWREGWKGDLAVDGHMVPVALCDTSKPTAPGSLHAYDPDSGFWPKHRKYGPVWAHQLLLAAAVHRTYERQVPNLALGVSIGKPSAGDTDLTLEAISALNAYSPKPGSAGRPRLICDQGFTYKRDFARAMHDLRYDLVMQYADGARVVHDLGNGAQLFNGVPICPEYLSRLTARHVNELPADHRKMSDEAFEDQMEFEKLAQGAVMRLNGRWRPSKSRPNFVLDGTGTPHLLPGAKAGRPRKDAESPTTLYLADVLCPGIVDERSLPRTRCTRVPESMQRLDPASFPIAAVDPLPRTKEGLVKVDELPHACLHAKTSARLDEAAFKQAQRYMRGTWVHCDIYQTARTANERWFSQLTHRTVGGLDLSARHLTGTARVGVITMASVAVSNITIGEQFARRVQKNGGEAPPCTRVAERAARARREQRLHQSTRAQRSAS
jgi:hypothetical protein